MCNFDNFDIVQISSKFAQRYHFVCNFNCKIFSILGSLDNAQNAQSTTFYESSNIKDAELDADKIWRETMICSILVKKVSRRWMIRFYFVGNHYCCCCVFAVVAIVFVTDVNLRLPCDEMIDHEMFEFQNQTIKRLIVISHSCKPSHIRTITLAHCYHFILSHLHTLVPS